MSNFKKKLSNILTKLRIFFGSLKLKVLSLIGYDFYVIYDNSYYSNRIKAEVLFVVGCAREPLAVDAYNTYVNSSKITLKPALVKYDILENERTPNVFDLKYVRGAVVTITGIESES